MKEAEMKNVEAEQWRLEAEVKKEEEQVA